MINVYISDDTTALSLFADEIADVISKEAQKRPVDINLTRKGSYGIFSYEPLIEIENKNGRYFIGPVKPGDIEEMFDGGMFGEDFRGFKVGFNFKSSGGRYGREMFFGETDGRSGLPGIPMLLSQKRLAFKRAVISLAGPEVRVGDRAPEAAVVMKDLKEKYAGGIKSRRAGE